MSRPLALAAFLLAACRAPAPPAPAGPGAVEDGPYVPFTERRAAHVTALRERGPSTGRYREGVVPEGAQAVRYPAGDHALLAWLALPPSAAEGPVPAVIYFHGAFSLTPSDFEHTRRFLDAGLAVLTPALRGENGNPGDLELLYGEIDDAVAATRWLATRPEIDGDHIYAVGHSIGGAVAAMLALFPGAPVRFTGSVGGIYVPETFQRWSRSEGNRALVRFDPFDPDEGQLRTLGPNVRDLVRPHHAYIGADDRWFHPNAEAVASEARRWDKPFSVEMVPGDHMSSLEPGLERFLVRIKADLDGG